MYFVLPVLHNAMRWYSYTLPWNGARQKKVFQEQAY